MEKLIPPGLLHRVRTQLCLVGLLAVANAMVLMVFLLPARREQVSLVATASTLENAQVARQLEESGAGTVAGVFRNNERDLAAFSGRLLPRKEFERFLGELFDFSLRAELVLDRIQYDPSTHAEHNILEYRLQFNIGGSYEQIRQFISLLENSPRMIAIRTLRFSGKEKEAERISATMEIDTFFQMEGS